MKFICEYSYITKHGMNVKMQEEKVSGGATESFGKQWGPGDVVGVFLDLVDHTISKTWS